MTFKEKVDSYEGHKPSKFKYHTLQFLFSFMEKKDVEYIYDFDMKEYKNKQVIVLADHASRNNYIYAVRGYKAPLVPVVGYQNIFKRFIGPLLLFYGIIPKYLYIPDTKCVRDLFRLKKEGASFLLFPEGIQSTVGTTHPMNPSTMKMIKKLGLEVVLCHSTGAYLSTPRYQQDTYNKGKMTFTYSKLFSEEDIKNLSVEELYEKYLEKFKFNDFKWNKENHIKYVGKKPHAQDIERILFHCPKCNHDFTLKSEGDKLICNNCNNTITIDEYYDMHVDSDSYMPYDRIDEWYLSQRKLVQKEIENSDFKYESKVMLKRLNVNLKKEKEYIAGEGTLVIDKETLTYKGTKDGENFELVIPLLGLPSVVITGDNSFEFYYDGEYYELFTLNGNKDATKVMITVEELHNLYDPGWRKASEDVYNI